MDTVDATAMAVEGNKGVKDRDVFRVVLDLNIVDVVARDFALSSKTKGGHLHGMKRGGSGSTGAVDALWIPTVCGGYDRF